jgi:hypothetical protein
VIFILKDKIYNQKNREYPSDFIIVKYSFCKMLNEKVFISISKTLYTGLLIFILFTSSIFALSISRDNSSITSALPTSASPGTPVIVDGPHAYSRHTGNDKGVHNYGLHLSVNVSDPLGLSDLASVIVTGPTGNSYTLLSLDNGWYELWTGTTSTPPPLGIYTFKVTDKSGNWIEATDNLTAIMDYPKNVNPAQYSFISSSSPTFSWDPVPGAVKYNLTVADENGNGIWSKDNLTATSVMFNYDLTATKDLKDNNIYSWEVNCSDAAGNTGEQFYWIQFIYSTNTNAPFLSNPKAHSAHYGDDFGNSEYVLFLEVQVSDPQGISDIGSVIVTGSGVNNFILKDDNKTGLYKGWFSGLSAPPQLGSYIFRATDKSNNWIEKVDILTAYLDYPRNVHPAQNEVTNQSTPTFSWDAVPGDVKYNISVNDNYGKWIWGRSGFTTTSVVYNDDGNAVENLKDGSTYTWSVQVTDADGNWGEHYGRRFSYSTNLTKPLIGKHNAVTYHGGDDIGNEDYGYDLWVEVADPQGYGDIASVILKTKGGIDYILTDDNGDGRYDRSPRGIPASSMLGQCVFKVTDKSNNITTALDTLSGWVQFAGNISPAYNEIVQTNSPVFHWDAVNGISYYQISVWPLDVPGNWSIDVINRTSVTYNENGTGQDLISGKRYGWDIRTFDAFGNYGYHNATEFIYSASATSPVISNPNVRSAHYGDDSRQQKYYLVLGIQVVDPQGIGDIASVSVTGPDNKIYTINSHNTNGNYDEWFGGSTDLPLLGTYKFKVTDKSGNWTEATDTLTAILDYPKNTKPSQNEVVLTQLPVFSWDAIPGSQTYTLSVNDNYGKQIWWKGNFTSTSVTYNDDGTATDNLKEGFSYSWTISGSDNDGNWGEQYSHRFAYSTNTTNPVVCNPKVRSRHWGQNDLSESWGINSWVYVFDPQGMSDIDSVWVDGPDNYHLRLLDDGQNNDDAENDGKFAHSGGGFNTPPTLGEYFFRAVDKTGNLVTIKDTLTTVLDYPKILMPLHNSVVTTPDFTISWDKVAGAAHYEVSVNSLDWSKTYWTSGRNLTQTSISYNADKTGSDISDGQAFYITIRLDDGPEGNESELNSLKIVYRINNRRTVYVDSLNTSGNENGTSDFPFNTIIEAISSSVSGDTVLVSPGSYQGQIDDVGSVSLFGGNPVTTIIHGYVGLKSANARVKGFTIRNSDRTGIEIHKNVTAEISNNIISGNSGAGIALAWDGPSNSIITNNTILNNRGDGIAIETSGSTSVISNNIIAYNSNGISLNTDATIYNSFNSFYSNSVDLVNLEKGDGEIFSDPKFVNYAEGDFNLQTVSPCIDTGNPDLDGDGEIWKEDPDDRDPDSTRFDIGALHVDQRLLYPDAPTGVIAGSCNDLVTLKWRKNTGLYFLRYRIYGGISNDPTIAIDSTINGISDTIKVLSGLIKGQSYYFRITAVNLGGNESNFSNQSSTTVQTGVLPKIKAKWGDVLICYNLGDSITSFQWYRDNSAIPNATNQYYISNKQAGSYMVETTDIKGCKNSSNIISISGSKSLTIYPNPASISFALKINEEYEGSALVSITNSAGIKVMEYQIENIKSDMPKEIPVDNLEEGIYYVQVLLNQKDLLSEKIVIIK